MLAALIENNIFISIKNSIQAIIENLLPMAIIAVVLIIIALIIYFFINFLISQALKKTKALKIESITILKIWKYIYWGIVALIIASSLSGNLAVTGLTLGLLSAALGWALQKPITGIASWLMIITKKPFQIGDIIMIDDIKGEVIEITMFYIVLKASPENMISGKEIGENEILIPTSLLFDKNIFNFTFKEPFTLTKISVSITYESNLQKAEEIIMNAIEERTKHVIEATGKKPKLNIEFGASSIDIIALFKVPAKELIHYRHDIAKKITEKIKESKEVEFAYPHIQLVK